MARRMMARAPSQLRRPLRLNERAVRICSPRKNVGLAAVSPQPSGTPSRTRTHNPPLPSADRTTNNAVGCRLSDVGCRARLNPSPGSTVDQIPGTSILETAELETPGSSARRQILPLYFDHSTRPPRHPATQPPSHPRRSSGDLQPVIHPRVPIFRVPVGPGIYPARYLPILPIDLR